MTTKYQYSQAELDVINSEIAELDPSKELTVFQRVQNGFEFFTRNGYNFELIDVNSFDIRNCHECIAAQFRGSYHLFIDEVVYDIYESRLYRIDDDNFVDATKTEYAHVINFSIWLGLTMPVDTGDSEESRSLQAAWLEKLIEIKGVKLLNSLGEENED